MGSPSVLSLSWTESCIQLIGNAAWKFLVLEFLASLSITSYHNILGIIMLQLLKSIPNVITNTTDLKTVSSSYLLRLSSHPDWVQILDLLLTSFGLGGCHLFLSTWVPHLWNWIPVSSSGYSENYVNIYVHYHMCYILYISPYFVFTYVYFFICI